ncbi:putative retrotransposon hot spot protein (RHS) [Trypanosoma cruzi]|uniref:Putative retrotransposon hot spot protein (RHS) n=1 Tax=Trypanosoma cruzi TaxID=5693 RepID=A0A2V2WU84_TRYCR|nr:putative retrotransposon hot spot (RHS) protein [Trypanosoma cruzi]PWV12178.1 putative retrotransposon hot spot protein (RHS) [Trypanosoma cruzi]
MDVKDRWLEEFLLVGLRITTACRHHRNASTVRRFTEYPTAYFDGWEDFARDMSWEFIYVQHAGIVLTSGWQRRDVVNSNLVSEEENQESLSFWKKKRTPVPSVNTIWSFQKRRSFSEVRKKQKIGKRDKLGNERDSLISGEKKYWGIFIYLDAFVSMRCRCTSTRWH